MKDAIMVMFEPHEWVMVIEGLMELRSDRLATFGVDESTWQRAGEEPETEELMRRIMLHIGLPDAELVVPTAYALCFPEGPPRIVGTYGKFTYGHDDEE